MKENVVHGRPFFSFLWLLVSLFFFLAQVSNAQNRTTPVNVGIVLDLDSSFGKITSSCIDMSLSDFYDTHPHYKTRLVLNVRDSKRDVVAAAAAAVDLIKNVEVQAIIGPANSMQTDFVVDLGHKSQVPIISFSAKSPSLSSIRSPYFIRATKNDKSQVKAISAIVQAFGWREAVPIYEVDEFGESLIPFLTDALQKIDTRVPYQSSISPSATDDQIVAELYKLMTMPTRVFIVHMLPNIGSRLFAKAKDIGMMSEGYVWIMTDAMTDLMSLVDLDWAQGALGVRTYVPKSRELESFRVRWKRRFMREDNPKVLDAEINIFALRAYDAAMALAMAVEKAGTANLSFDKTRVSSTATDLESLGVSRYGTKLVEALSSTKFRGLTGDFHHRNQELQSTTYQIVNVNSNGQREIGFWTPENGLAKKLTSANTALSSTRNTNLGPIIWPGDSMSVPKGWEIPTNGKKLRIGVPVKSGLFSKFVKVVRDPGTNTTMVTGFCIEVFRTVIKSMPYAVTYDLIPFATADGESAGSYDDLIYQVYLGKLDAAVGDITIVANRSSFVDFTLPYTESGVSMVVPVSNNGKKNAWVFLKPLTWDLWLTSACFFIFIGFVVWVLEHRINEDFRGPPRHQVGTSFWFSFSTMVFAQRERVVSNLARFVVIIWCFVVLILIQSYTASLTALLTVQQLQPTVTDVNELIKKGENVGYLEGSFVHGILKKLGFPEANLKVYSCPKELDELFSKGTASGGIAAAFDEVPYIKLFLGEYCSKYTMINPTFRTGGFGFVFPLRSPLARDISSVILNVTQGDKMTEIQEAWFKKQGDCPENRTSVSSNSLDLDSFWGLFLIAGVASFLALFIFTAMFLYEHREFLRHSDSKESVWRRILTLLRTFDQRDLSSHTFRKGEDRSGVRILNGVAMQASPNTDCPPSPSTSQNTHCPPSPSTSLNHPNSDFSFFTDQGSPPYEYLHPNPSGQLNDVISTTQITNPDQSTPITLEIALEHN